MEYKTLEKTIETMETNPRRSSSGKARRWIIGITLVAISIAYQQCSSQRRIEYQKQLLDKQYQEQKLRLDMQMKKLVNESIERNEEERARKREGEMYKSLKEMKAYK